MCKEHLSEHERIVIYALLPHDTYYDLLHRESLWHHLLDVFRKPISSYERGRRNRRFQGCEESVTRFL